MIEAELKKLRADVYCYESNETGTKISDEVRARLEECNEFLILLTPTSVRSDWVRFELDIACYLRKVIRPFFMYVKDEDIPLMVRDLVRRPMGDIDRYYDEVREKMIESFREDMAQAIVPAASPPIPPVTEDPSLLRDRAQKIVRVVPAESSEPEPEARKPRKNKRGGRKSARRK